MSKGDLERLTILNNSVEPIADIILIFRSTYWGRVVTWSYFMQAFKPKESCVTCLLSNNLISLQVLFVGLTCPYYLMLLYNLLITFFKDLRYLGRIISRYYYGRTIKSLN